MKKTFALVLCVMLACLCASSALASKAFSYTGETTSFTRWSSDDDSAGSDWYLTWSDSNLTSSLQAAVKIYSAPGVYASHTFYYSSKSTSSHSYLTSISESTNVYVAGKRYKGTEKIKVAGTFYP